jgi:hypothetical protein
VALNSAGLKAAVDGLATAIVYVSLHTADPGATGAAEVTGGTPAYTRRAVTWTAAVAGVRGLNAAVTFDVPSATTVTYFGLWSAATGGTFLGGDVLRDADDNPASEAFATQGIYQLTKATLTVSPAP